MNGLRDEDATTILRIGASAGLVVIVLPAPPGDIRAHHGYGAERTLPQHLGQLHRCLAGAMLKNHAHLHPGRLGNIDQFFSRLETAIEGFFKQDMLACLSTGLDDLAAGIGRREDKNSLGRHIVRDGLDAVEGTDTKITGGGGTACFVAHVKARNLDPPFQLLESLQMRPRCHAQSDDCQFHMVSPPKA